ncbi:MAG TPA: hypothetical protein VF821_06860 [Lentzea sp.]
MDPSRARELLQLRVEAYSDELCDKMTGMLDRLLALRPSVAPATRPAVDAALDAFVSACRKVAFDRSFFGTRPGPRPQPGLVAAPDLAAVDALVDDLDALQALLNKNAEWQEWVDANNNAMEYRAAATYVQHTRVILT